MENENNNFASQNEIEEGDERAFDIWSDEGARRFNEIIEEGAAYALANPDFVKDFGEEFDDRESECLDPDLYDPDEETLTPGEIEIIVENCYTN